LADWDEQIVQLRTKFIVDTFLKAINYKDLM
jgi:hypothetical protein